MRIFHTSNLIVSEPDVYHSRHHLDFGDGMYLTPLEKQARDYGQRFIRRGEPAIMNIYEFAEEITDVNRKVFPAYDGEWPILYSFSANMHASSNCLQSRQA